MMSSTSTNFDTIEGILADQGDTKDSTSNTSKKNIPFLMSRCSEEPISKAENNYETSSMLDPLKRVVAGAPVSLRTTAVLTAESRIPEALGPTSSQCPEGELRDPPPFNKSIMCEMGGSDTAKNSAKRKESSLGKSSGAGMDLENPIVSGPLLDQSKTVEENISTSSSNHSVMCKWSEKYDFGDEDDRKPIQSLNHIKPALPQSLRNMMEPDKTEREDREPSFSEKEISTNETRLKAKSNWFCSISPSPNKKAVRATSQNITILNKIDDGSTMDESTVVFNVFPKEGDSDTESYGDQHSDIPEVSTRQTAGLGAQPYKSDKVSLEEDTAGVFDEWNKEETKDGIVVDRKGFFSSMTDTIAAIPQLLCMTPRMNQCLLSKNSKVIERRKITSPWTVESSTSAPVSLRERMKTGLKAHRESFAPLVTSKSSCSDGPNVESELKQKRSEEEKDTVVVVDAVMRALRKTRKPKGVKRDNLPSDTMNVLVSLSRFEHRGFHTTTTVESKGISRVTLSHDGPEESENNLSVHSLTKEACGEEPFHDQTENNALTNNRKQCSENNDYGPCDQFVTLPSDVVMGSDDFSTDYLFESKIPKSDEERLCDLQINSPSKTKIKRKKDAVHGTTHEVSTKGDKEAFERISLAASSSFQFVNSLSLSDDRIPTPPHHVGVVSSTNTKEIKKPEPVKLLHHRPRPFGAPLHGNSEASKKSNCTQKEMKNSFTEERTIGSVLSKLSRSYPKKTTHDVTANNVEKQGRKEAELEVNIALSLSEESPIPPLPSVTEEGKDGIKYNRRKQIGSHITIHRMLRNANVEKSKASKRVPLTEKTRKAALQLTIEKIAEGRLRKDRKRLQPVLLNLNRSMEENECQGNKVGEICNHEPNHQRRHMLPKGILRASDIDGSGNTVIDQKKSKRVRWDEAQLANKIEKGVMFQSNGKWRKPAYALARLMAEINLVQESYGAGLENVTLYQHGPQGYIC